jgi:hypothetical protein
MHRTQSGKPKKIEAKEIKISLSFSHQKEKKENRDARAAPQSHDCGLICGYERREHQKPNNINARWRKFPPAKVAEAPQIASASARKGRCDASASSAS